MVKRLIVFLISIGLLAGVAVPAFGAEAAAVNVGGNADHGNFLVGPNGMSLYIFTKDSVDTSVCSGGCAASWPPLRVAEGTTPTAGSGVPGKLGTIARTDGTPQVTYNGWPLYSFAEDAKVGDATGQGLGNIWWVMKTDTVGTGMNSDLGDLVVGNNGMTVYIFLKDEAGKSNCTGNCAVNWPPLTVSAGTSPTRGADVTGKLGTITRADGTRPVTYNDWPLYYWVKDAKPGEATGQNVGNVWFVVQPSTVSMSSSAELGSFLTGFNGMTLYTFTKDTAGVSNCSGQCAVNWPPLTIRNGESVLPGKGVLGGLGLIKRADGPSQITYNGWPLYYWIKDAKPGDTTGHNVGTVWLAADPDISPTNYQKLLNRQLVNERLIQLLSSISAQRPATLQAEFDAIQKAYLDVIAGNKDMIKWQSGG